MTFKQLVFQLMFLATVGSLSRQAYATIHEEPHSGIKLCCEIAIKLQEQNLSLDAISYESSVAACEPIFKLCTDLHQKNNKFFGKSHLEDINECEIQNNGCDVSQECVNTYGSYICIPPSVCRIGYKFNEVDSACDLETDFTTTTGSDTETIPMFDTEIHEMIAKIIEESLCDQGFIFNNQTNACEDINECTGKVCDHFCVNLLGSFNCTCSEGYRINPNDRTTCEDIDECNEGKSGCSHGCVNKIGCYSCQCPEGFKLSFDRKTCLDIESCPEGFRLGNDGFTCEDINECLAKREICSEKICNNFIGGFTCHDSSCPDGYREHNRANATQANKTFNKCMRKRCPRDGQLLDCRKKPKYIVYKNVTLGSDTKFCRGVALHKINSTRFLLPTEVGYQITDETGLVVDDKDIIRIIEEPHQRVIVLSKPLKVSRRIKLIVHMQRNVKKRFEIELNINVNIQKFP